LCPPYLDTLWSGVRLEINVDDAEKSQVDLPLKAFFGVMHDWEPYFVDNAAYTVLPNPGAKAKDPLIPGNPGYNLFLPIPFSESCRITLHVSSGTHSCGYGRLAPV
jgi:hypothetical protein